MNGMIFFAMLFLLPCCVTGQDLVFVHKKNGKITSFALGDNVGITLKTFCIPDKVSGVLVDFNEEQITINKKTYLFGNIQNIRHSKPIPDLVLGLTGAISLIIAGFLLVPLLLPIPDKKFAPFLIFLLMGYGSLIVKEINTGYRVALHKHKMTITEISNKGEILNQNP